MWATALIGIGMMSSIDEIIYHQILAWHHFYDRSTPQIGLVADGLLHAANLVAIVAGFFLFADLIRRHTLVRARAWAGFFLGLGGFQLFDGLIDHKVLRLHQIRYGVELFPYDLAWNAAGVLLLIIGVILTMRAKKIEQRTSLPRS